MKRLQSINIIQLFISRWQRSHCAEGIRHWEENIAIVTVFTSLAALLGTFASESETNTNARIAPKKECLLFKNR